MSRNKVEMLDKLNKSIQQCQEATDRYLTKYTESTAVQSKLPDLTDYLKQCQARQRNGYPLSKKESIAVDDSKKSNTNQENSEPNSRQHSIATHLRK